MWINRKSVAALAVAGSLTIAGCSAERGGSPAGQPAGAQTLTIWAPAGTEGDFVRKVVEKWNAGHATKFVAQDLPAATASEDGIAAAVAAKSTPEILIGASTAQAPSLAESGGILNLSKEFPDAESFVTERSGQAILDGYRAADGSLSIVPWRTNPVMVFYNKALLRKAGLDPEKPPATYSEYLAAFKALKAAGIAPIAQSIDQTWWHRNFDWYPTYLAAAGHGLLTAKVDASAFNEQAGVESMTFWREVFAKGYNARSSAGLDDTNPFNQGKSAFYFSGPWNIPSMTKEVTAEAGISTVPVPDAKASGTVTTYGDMKHVVIFSTAKDKTASWEFVKFYLNADNDATFLSDMKQIPLRTSLAGDVGEAFFKENPLLVPFVEQAGSVLDLDLSTKTIDVLTALSTAYQSAAIYGEQPVAEALKQAADQVDQLVGK